MSGLVRLCFVIGSVALLTLAGVTHRAWATDCAVEGAGEGGAFTPTLRIQGDCTNLGSPAKTSQPDLLPVVDAAPDGEVEPEPVWALEPVWGVHPETGEACLDLVESGEVTVNDPIGLSWESRMLTMLHDARLEGVEHRWCDGSSSLLVADPSPQVHRFVRTIELPAPELWVAPGYALTGMPAFLQIEQQEPFGVDGTIAGFGGLEVVLAPQVFEVAWGDGTVEVIDDGRAGAAWDGPVAEQISHTYVDTDEGSVVRVEANWHAVWRVGGFSGVVDDLQVVGELDLPVQTRRAVRVAPDHTP